MEFMLILALVLAAGLLAAWATILRDREKIRELEERVDALEEMAELLPLDELEAQAAFEKSYADALENLSNYSYDVAMKGGGERN